MLNRNFSIFLLLILLQNIYGDTKDLHLKEIDYCKSCLSFNDDECIQLLNADSNSHFLKIHFEERELNYKYMGYFFKPFIGITVLSAISLIILTASTEGSNDNRYNNLVNGIKITGAIELSNISIFIGGLLFFKKRNNTIDIELKNHYRNSTNPNDK